MSNKKFFFFKVIQSSILQRLVDLIQYIKTIDMTSQIIQKDFLLFVFSMISLGLRSLGCRFLFTFFILNSGVTFCCCCCCCCCFV